MVLGTVGRLNYEKGIDRLLDQLGTIAGRVKKLTYFVIGDGPLRETLEKQAKRLGLSDRVVFCGWRRPMQSWYEAMDVLVLPSRTEGLPNVVLEAMAMGVPVAATDVGGVGDLLEGGRYGVILPDEANLWAELMIDLLIDRDKREHLANEALKQVSNNFTFAGRMEKMTALYDELFGYMDNNDNTKFRQSSQTAA